MGFLRRTILSSLPKLALSRTTGCLTRIRLPRWARAKVYTAYARRYGADLGEMDGALADYPSLSAFFVRPLRDGARPLAADAPVVWPCDGKIVTSGAIDGDHLDQIKGVSYSLAELVADPELAAALEGGSQATIYLAPKDYHRVHVPFDGELRGTHHVPGSLFPVNPGAVRSIPKLFARNERVAFRFVLPSGITAAVVMVAALNVGDIQITAQGGALRKGDELGRFGFGSTTVVLIARGGPVFAALAPETVVRVNASAALA